MAIKRSYRQFWHYLALGLFLSAMAICSVTPCLAQQETPDDQADAPNADAGEKALSEGLEKLEKAIDNREQFERHGHPIIMEYTQELESEYRRNAESLSQISIEAKGDRAGLRTKLENRQQQLSMLLWQLARVNSVVGQGGTDSRALMSEAQKLTSKHRQALLKPQLMKRYQAVMRRLMTLNRARFSSTNRISTFYFLRPDVTSKEASGGDVASKGLPGQSTDRSRFPVGPIQALQEPIGRLIHLAWRDGNLAWDESHWDRQFAGFTLNQIDELVREELRKRELELGEQDRSNQMRNERLYGTHPAMLLFQNLQHVASGGKPTSRSSSGSNDLLHARFRNANIEGVLIVSNSLLKFTLNELSGPKRMMQVIREKGAKLRVSVIGDSIFVLNQSNNGAVRIVNIDDEVKVEQADSFAKLYAQSPQLIEEDLFPLLVHYGILPPRDRSDDALISRAKDRIKGIDPTTRQRFADLLSKMDSGNFSVRQKASRELSSNADLFSFLLLETSDDDGRSPETTTRLSQLRKKYSEHFTHLDSILNETGWLKSPAFLINALQHCDHDTQVFVDRLQQITGQSFGSDLDRWQEWLEQVTPDEATQP